MDEHGLRRWPLVCGFLLSITLLLCTALSGRVQAGALSISPVRVSLASGTTSALITVQNESPDPVRLQLSLHAWRESPDGLMQLTPTEDLVVFPVLLKLKPEESRKIRVGLPAPQEAPVEKTYRLFLEELPSSAKLGANEVRVLARIGVPIFLAPPEPKSGWAPTVSPHGEDGVMLELKNTGNVHLILQEVTVRGIDHDEQVVFDQTLTGGYLLADSVRNHTIKVTSADRAKLTACVVQIVTAAGPQEERVNCPSSPVNP